MMMRSVKWLSFPLHVFLLVIFFVVNGYRSNMEIMWAGDLLPVGGILLLLGGLLLLLAHARQRSWQKAGLYVFFFMLLLLFYGVAEDFLKNTPLKNIAKINWLLPAFLCMLVVVCVLVGRSKRNFKRATVFLNVLLGVYILLDLGAIGLGWLRGDDRLDPMTSLRSPPGLARTCHDCDKPDIYLVVIDEYMGTPELRSYFGYDNSSLQKRLREQEFLVVENAYSNYRYTDASIASMLNMQFIEPSSLQGLEGFDQVKRKLLFIKDNMVCSFLRREGYRISNQSIFQLRNAPASYSNSFIPLQSNIFTGKTLYRRLLVAIAGSGYYANNPWLQDWIGKDLLRNNRLMMERTLENADRTSNTPLFTYTHLLMPHAPFAYDSLGNRNYHIPKNSKETDTAYLHYLVYANKKITAFITELKRRTQGKAVILLMGDHGYKGSKEKGRHQTLNAVYLPQKNYEGWHEGFTHVNQFPAVFNAVFNYRLPMLKDSLVPGDQ
jgi:hypothetical protein